MASTTPAPVDPHAASAADAVVVTRAVKKHYGAVRAVDGVDLEIRRGELFGLIGHNGAGKTTLFKMMLGLIPLSGGEILINNTPISGHGFREVRKRIGYLPENIVLYDNLTGLETLQFFSRLKRAPAGDCQAALQRVGLAHAARRRVREYSKGMRQRLGFAQALLGTPQILFLDEPTTGLDPEAIHEFYDILRKLREDGVTMILTSHILAEIQQRVDRLAIMTEGRIRALGSVQALREQLQLPVWFEVRLAGGDADSLRGALASAPISTIEQRVNCLAVHCRREDKIAVLEALAGLGGQLQDLHIHEPSLEDVFFGLSQPGA